MKIKIIKYKTVTSTNDVAINLIKNKNKEMGFVYADKQTNGKGTYGKKWVSQKGNLFGSYGYSLSNIFQLELLNIGTFDNTNPTLNKNAKLYSTY